MIEARLMTEFDENSLEILIFSVDEEVSRPHNITTREPFAGENTTKFPLKLLMDKFNYF
jgi:hypothetical protein